MTRFNPAENVYRQRGGLCEVLDLHKAAATLPSARVEPSFSIMPAWDVRITVKDTVFRSIRQF